MQGQPDPAHLGQGGTVAGAGAVRFEEPVRLLDRPSRQAAAQLQHAVADLDDAAVQAELQVVHADQVERCPGRGEQDDRREGLLDRAPERIQRPVRPHGRPDGGEPGYRRAGHDEQDGDHPYQVERRDDRLPGRAGPGGVDQDVGDPVGRVRQVQERAGGDEVQPEPYEPGPRPPADPPQHHHRDRQQAAQVPLEDEPVGDRRTGDGRRDRAVAGTGADTVG